MKSFLLIAFSFLLSLSLYGQRSYVDIFNSHSFPCDSEATTLEINICSGQKADFADSLLNKLYKSIVKGIDKEIVNDNKQLTKLQGLKTKNKESESNIGVLIKEINYDKRLKQSIINSQAQWIKLRDANSKVVSINCEGGTGCTAEINSAWLEETLLRIKQLESFYQPY
jgi:uncharacterized protein YecT (DUF1311 family)